jgi:hypothetical protein
MVDSSMTKTTPIADLRENLVDQPTPIALRTILLECFTMKFWEVSWRRFQNSSWQSSLRYPINSRSPELQQPSLAGHDWIVPWHQDRAAWGTVWLIFDMVNFACTTLMSFEFSQGRSSAIQQMHHGCCFLLFLSSQGAVAS